MQKKDYQYFKEKTQEILKIPQIQKLDRFIQHGKVNRLEHSVYVAYSSFRLCKKLKLNVDYNSLIRGALLHDYFLYEHTKEGLSAWHHGIYHPYAAYQNANSLFLLTNIEKDIIRNHMWPLTLFHIPKCKESVIVCIVDKLCAILEFLHWSIPQLKIY